MARRVYYAFHFDEDIFRVNQVRMSNVVAGADRAGFYDHSEYLEAKKKGDAEISRMIRNKLEGTSVTVVLIGTQTAERRWVQFEVDESVRRQNGLLGVYITTSRTLAATRTRSGRRRPCLRSRRGLSFRR